jgi:multicomponent Na+:H+ antiporter subunit C
MNVVFAVTVGMLFGLGVYQLLRRDLIKAAMGFALLFTSVNLLLLAVGAYNGVTPAYTDQEGQPSDPLVQALILTAIVVSFGSYALLLGLVTVVSTRFGTIRTDDVDQLQR